MLHYAKLLLIQSERGRVYCGGFQDSELESKLDIKLQSKLNSSN